MAISEIHQEGSGQDIMAGAKSDVLEIDLQPQRSRGRPLTLELLDLVDRRRWSIFCGIALAYLLAFNGQWLVEPDGGLYLNLARNLALGRGYTYAGIHHETVYPGFPLMLAGLYKLAGNHLILAADIFILLCSAATLALVYRLVLLAYDRPTAVLVTLGVGLSHEFFQYSFEILTDMPFLMGVMAVLAGHEAIFGPGREPRGRWWDWALLAAGAIVATSTRPTMIGLLLAWIAALLYAALVQRNFKAWIPIGIIAGVVGLFVLLDPRRAAGHVLPMGYEQYAINQLSQLSGLRLTATANIRALLDPILVKSAFGMRLLPGMNSVFGIAVAASAVALIARRLLWGLWVILTLAAVILFVSNDRYLLAILPLMVLGWWNLVRKINLQLSGRLGSAIALLLLTLGTAPNITQIVDTIYHQRLHPFLAEYRDGKYEPFARIAPDVAQDTGPQDVILCPTKSARMIAFLADRMCVEENEPYSGADHLFVIIDPLDVEFVPWLRSENIQPVGEILARANRRGGLPAIYLMRAQLGGAK
jgi:Dolichyl-phosphate-mannose-protein mannosyltransferase